MASSHSARTGSFELNRYAAPDNGGDTGDAYLPLVIAHQLVRITAPGSIRRPRGAGLSPIPNSLDRAFRRLLVPIIADRVVQLAGTLAAALRYVKSHGPGPPTAATLLPAAHRPSAQCDRMSFRDRHSPKDLS